MKIKKSTILITKLISSAKNFRLGHEAEASHEFRKCIELLEELLPEKQNQEEIMSLLRDMLAAQERNDWLSLADYLEYELTEVFT